MTREKLHFSFENFGKFVMPLKMMRFIVGIEYVVENPREAHENFESSTIWNIFVISGSRLMEKGLHCNPRNSDISCAEA